MLEKHSLGKQSLFNNFLQKLQREKVLVSIFLVNGIKLQGQLEDFDDEVLILKNNILQLVFKHAISTVVPSKNVTPVEPL